MKKRDMELLEGNLPAVGWLHASEVARALGVSVRTIERWVAAGAFPGATRTVGGHLRIPPGNWALPPWRQTRHKTSRKET